MTRNEAKEKYNRLSSTDKNAVVNILIDSKRKYMMTNAFLKVDFPYYFYAIHEQMMVDQNIDKDSFIDIDNEEDFAVESIGVISGYLYDHGDYINE